MDTDDLSEEAYNAIIIQSEKFHHDLTLQFGVLSSSCENEDEYLNESLILIEEWEDDLETAVDEIFFEDFPPLNKFIEVLEKLKESIKEIQKIPNDKKTYKEW
ncbi:MAG: hypothetical protein Q8M94_01020 [Ignavibacteria bacterium]|nr:hypothetical protein [Ignavibacteria bacterium]